LYAHRVYPGGVAVKGTVNGGVPREVLDLLQVSATSESELIAASSYDR
jgi:hypothetical protein